MTLKELRKLKGLTQLEASTIVSVPLRTYKRIENDHRYVSSYKYDHIYDLLNQYIGNNDNQDITNATISVVGLGYVGLSNAVILSQHNKVYAVDIDINKIDLIKKGICPFVDKDIDIYLKNKKLDLIPTTDTYKAYKESEYILICTPTDYDPNTNKFDTSSVESVIKEIISINNKATIIIKSTIGVGFTNKIIKEYQYDKIMFSPEFLREGKALYDNLYPSRIIVGVNKENIKLVNKAKHFISLLKQGAMKKDIKTRILGTKEAEAVKLFANTYLAMRVAYFNELDTFSEIKGLNTLDIIQGISDDPRIGDYYNNPSFGYGGYCLPKDTKELKENFSGVNENLISAVIESNETRKKYIANKVLEKVKDISHPIIGIYRLTMKSKSDNFRTSSIFDVIKELKKNNVDIIIYEPNIKEDTYQKYLIIKDIDVFKKKSDIIIANRYESVLDDIKNKIYTRDLMGKD